MTQVQLGFTLPQVPQALHPGLKFGYMVICQARRFSACQVGRPNFTAPV